MKKNRKRVLLGCMAGMMLLCTGCNSVKYEPEVSGVFIRKDGSVKSAEIEPFDNSGFTEERYKESELKSFVEDAVISYNEENCGQSAAYAKDTKEELKVAIEKLEVKSNTATLILDYASCQDYLSFSEADDAIVALSVQTAPEAADENISLDGLVDAEGNAADTSSMESNKKYYVAEVAGTSEIVVEGKLMAVSSGVTVKDKNTAVIDSEDPVILVFK
ncbi:MAG: hypothetical protein PUB22_01025 [Clostridiales bacterium]|nr:hypothetical protein [Clostridiales bacterium]